MKSYSFNTQSGLVLTYHVIPITEGRRLVEDENGKLLREYSSDFCESYFYLLNDQKVVHIPMGLEAYVYEPYEAFIAHMKESHIMKKIPDSYPRKRLKRLRGGRKIYFSTFDKQELEVLLLNGKLLDGTKRDYVLESGQVLVNNLYSGDLYNNLEDYSDAKKNENFNNNLLQSKESRDSKDFVWGELCGINPYGNDFPSHIDELIEKLPNLIYAPSSIFDFKFDSLLDIDKYLYDNMMTYEFQEQVFLPLLAYLGKTYIQEKGGHWVVMYDEACGSWVPDVRQADGKLKMLYYPISTILNPEEGHGTYLALRSVFFHTISNPMDS